MKDVKKFIKAKKRKRLIKRVTLITVIAIVALFAFFTKAPIFNIKTIDVVGNSTISKEVLLSKVSDRIGINIFTINVKGIKEDILETPYVKTVDVYRRGANTLQIKISEEAPVYYINDNGNLSILNNNLDVLEVVDNIEGRRLVEVVGVDLTALNDEVREQEVHSWKSILNNFYPFISENREEIYISTLDISNIVDIKGKIGEVEVFFGDDSDLHNKMENVYRIILDESINLTKGYVNVGFKGMPVIKHEEEQEES